MSVLANDIVFYNSVSPPEADTGASGGVIDLTSKPVFVDVGPAGNIQIVSSASDTTQTVTVTGRRSSGVEISEVKTLLGTTAVPMTTEVSWDRLLKAVKSASTTGDIAVEATTITRNNTAMGGAAQTTSVMAYIDLDAGASAADDAYNGQVIRITGGAGSGQIRTIIDYVGATKRAFVSRDWSTAPTATSVFRVAQGMVFDKLPSEILTVKRIAYKANAEPAAGNAKSVYSKVFAKNTHATLALLAATISEVSDPMANFTFALDATVNATTSVVNRLTSPGFTFNATAKVVPGVDLGPTAAIGIWLRLLLDAGEPAADSFINMGVTGDSV